MKPCMNIITTFFSSWKLYIRLKWRSSYQLRSLSQSNQLDRRICNNLLVCCKFLRYCKVGICRNLQLKNNGIESSALRVAKTDVSWIIYRFCYMLSQTKMNQRKKKRLPASVSSGYVSCDAAIARSGYPLWWAATCGHIMSSLSHIRVFRYVSKSYLLVFCRLLSSR